MCKTNDIEQKTKSEFLKEIIEYSEELNKRMKESEKKEIKETDIRHPSV